jgi:hypothetical protein
MKNQNTVSLADVTRVSDTQESLRFYLEVAADLVRQKINVSRKESGFGRDSMRSLQILEQLILEQMPKKEQT